MDSDEEDADVDVIISAYLFTCLRFLEFEFTIFTSSWMNKLRTSSKASVAQKQATKPVLLSQQLQLHKP